MDIGLVYSGIELSGKIVAAQKLDLNVYKKDVRIDRVNIKNGSSVKKGDLLLAFDNSDFVIVSREASLAVLKSKVDLAEEKIKGSQENI